MTIQFHVCLKDDKLLRLLRRQTRTIKPYFQNLSEDELNCLMMFTDGTDKAHIACESSGVNPDYHFRETTCMIAVGYGE